VFDFEYARADTRVLDLAYALVFFAFTFRGGEAQYHRELSCEFLGHYQGAAQSVCPLSEEERAALPLALEISMWGCLAWAIRTEDPSFSGVAAGMQRALDNVTFCL
jgi:Ser/Thr protein kinase RdoA (MazF antagonist)